MLKNLKVMKEKLKNNVSVLINDGNIREAESLLKQYEEIIPNDVEIYSIKSVILNLQGKLYEAIDVLLEGLELDSNNFDINYNLADIYEQEMEMKNAVVYYNNAYKNCNDKDFKDQIKQKIQYLVSEYNIDLNDVQTSIKNGKPKIKSVLFIQTVQCIRTYKVAKVLNAKGVRVDIIYVGIAPNEVYTGLELPYTNMYKLRDINEMMNFINNSDYDILYSSNEPDYLTVLFSETNKPIIHDTHDMMSLRGDLKDEQIILEYLANKKSDGNIFVTESVKNIAIDAFRLQNKEMIVYNNYPLKEQLPVKFYKKLSESDGEIHCVYEGGLNNSDGHHRNIGDLFLKLAENRIHVHFYAPFKSDYYQKLENKSKYIHCEGTKSPAELLTELTQYDIGLAILNVTSRNKQFLDTTFPNKVWEYLAAGLPILFSDLEVFRAFSNNNKVGEIINFNKNILEQVNDVLNIKIGKDFLIKNKFTMDDKADDIIEFLYKVKNNYLNKSKVEKPTTLININKKDIVDLINENKFDSAKILIEKYKSILDDPEVSYYESLIYMYQNQIEKAESTVRESLGKYRENFQLLFGLACIEEIKGNYLSATNYYKLAIRITTDKKQKEEIQKTIERLNNKISSLGIDVVEEKFLNKGKILIIRSMYSVYIKELVEKFNQYYNTKFDILTFDNKYKTEVLQESFNKVIISPNNTDDYKNILNNLDYYDVINIHYLTPLYGIISKEIRKKCSKLIITIWGSDFYRSSNDIREVQRNILKEADIITFDNEVTREDFINYYGEEYRYKTTINLFGLTALEYINNIENLSKKDLKNRYGIDENTVVISCGYNATEAHNHLPIIDSILKCGHMLPNNLFFIFPMTYGRDEVYINKVKSKLEESNLNYLLLEDFMDFEKVAEVTKVSDVMIQLQTTDTLSASMQEHMYCGNLIITGSWLPYSPLKDKGVYFREIDDVSDVGSELQKVLNNLEFYKHQCEINPRLIFNMSSWQNTIESWKKTLTCIELGEKSKKFDHKTFWNNRYNKNFNIESSGYIGLGKSYNTYLYKSRFDVLKLVDDKLIKGLDNKNILEFGPGTGMFTQYFYNKNIKEYYGLEISDVAVNKLKDKYKGFSFFAENIVNDDIYSCINVKFDLIFSAEYLMHIIDDNDLRKVIQNIKNNLKDDGYFVEFDPISFGNIDNRAEYMNFIQFNKLQELFEEQELEIISIIPLAFFMDQPFDYEIFGQEGQRYYDIFYFLKQYFSTTKQPEEYKEKLANVIFDLDKLLCLKFNTGMTQKALIVRKKAKNDINVSMNDIWNKEELTIDLKEKIKSIYMKIENEELLEILNSLIELL